MRKHKSTMERKTKAERCRAGIITWLYDMDIIFGLDGNFDEPGNLLVNADCELKICDFGLARGFNQAQKQGFMTEYVATRWYCMPELMLSFANYMRLRQHPASAINVWSVGCILDERLAGKPIFKGKDYVDQLNQILHYLGTPRAQDYIPLLPIRPHVPFAQMFPHVNPLALDLLTKMLNFDPAKCIACEQVLERPYLTIWHDPMDEAICPAKFDLFFEEEDLIKVNLFRSEVHTAACSNQNRQLMIPFHNNIVASLIRDDTPLDGATSCYYSGHTPQQGVGHRPESLVIDDPSAELERKLAGTHIRCQ
ncbi:CMGC/MAPK/ERK protein kinase [Russula earlei]|uniref:CMGC/MAPK/ERK protein kinase n=1 Tax=Russula earlei TaxID=71964 RepID=A0ACC0U372_9AGAM|nr:CMGC/MAPK/ERK protein kinase [Russula earlei]